MPKTWRTALVYSIQHDDLRMRMRMFKIHWILWILQLLLSEHFVRVAHLRIARTQGGAAVALTNAFA